MHKRPYTSASSMEPSAIRPRRCYRLYEFPILRQLRRTAAPSNDLRCDAYQLEKLKPEQIQMSYLCNNGSVVHGEDSLQQIHTSVQITEHGSTIKLLQCDAYQLEKLKPEQIQMSYLCDDGSVVHGEDSLQQIHMSVRLRNTAAPSNDLRYDAYQLEKLAVTNNRCRTYAMEASYVGKTVCKQILVGTITEHGGTIK